MSQLAQAVERAVREMKEQAAAKRKKALPEAQPAVKSEVRRRAAAIRNARRPNMEPEHGAETAAPMTGTAQEAQQDEGASDMAKKAKKATRAKKPATVRKAAKPKAEKKAKTAKPAKDKSIQYGFLNIRVEQAVRTALLKMRDEQNTSLNALVGPALKKLAGL